MRLLGCTMYVLLTGVGTFVVDEEMFGLFAIYVMVRCLRRVSQQSPRRGRSTESRGEGA